MSIDKHSDVFLKACAAQKADPRLVAAIVTIESTWNTFAYAFEPECNLEKNVARYAYVQHFTRDSERNLQHASFGLMQVLGVTARDMGFAGFLPELFQPEVGLYWGIRYLNQQLKRYAGRIEDTVAAYNAGSAGKTGGVYTNQPYVDKVMRVYNHV